MKNPILLPVYALALTMLAPAALAQDSGKSASGPIPASPEAAAGAPQADHSTNAPRPESASRAEPAHRPAAASRREPTRIYRQVLPDGRIVYSDETVSGAKVDHTITMTPPIKGNLWSTEPGTPPKVTPQPVPTPVQRIDPVRKPAAGKSTIAVPDAVLSEVIRAEMLLEDAKKRQAAGTKPLPGEERDNSDGGLSFNQAYFSRQKRLARDVEYAESELKKALATRDGVVPPRK
ncbi:hypothetical protein EDC30_104247 [Paucimonas lemoignei]|uniref:DUF4124 domain-containing protein n=1 Tax=Paucimonas lemoignei TaxID=29443 RepID=A0A4R3HXA1_PAULE|nr:hypothetical protein [Paucimonas lemoignei]TCS37444.1 hypothetical protein EDC30_104247 [Paucimonas lemoignei]